MLVVSLNWSSTSKSSDKLVPLVVDIDEEVEALELLLVAAAVSVSDSGPEASG
jgi:hypothetical protein